MYLRTYYYHRYKMCVLKICETRRWKKNVHSDVFN